MRVEDCIALYPRMSQRIFGEKRKSLHGFWRAKYDAKNLKEEIEAIVEDRVPPHNQGHKYRLLPSPDDLCKT
jgi:hypothetical protein